MSRIRIPACEWLFVCVMQFEVKTEGESLQIRNMSWKVTLNGLSSQRKRRRKCWIMNKLKQLFYLRQLLLHIVRDLNYMPFRINQRAITCVMLSSLSLCVSPLGNLKLETKLRKDCKWSIRRKMNWVLNNFQWTDDSFRTY